MEPSIRSNLVIAMGDLAFRFPNLLEPWTHEMYQPLNDPDKGQHSHPFSTTYYVLHLFFLLPPSACSHCKRLAHVPCVVVRQ